MNQDLKDIIEMGKNVLTSGSIFIDTIEIRQYLDDYNDETYNSTKTKITYSKNKKASHEDMLDTIPACRKLERLTDGKIEKLYEDLKLNTDGYEAPQETLCILFKNGKVTLTVEGYTGYKDNDILHSQDVTNGFNKTLLDNDLKNNRKSY